MRSSASPREHGEHVKLFKFPHMASQLLGSAQLGARRKKRHLLFVRITCCERLDKLLLWTVMMSRMSAAFLAYGHHNVLVAWMAPKAMTMYVHENEGTGQVLARLLQLQKDVTRAGDSY